MADPGAQAPIPLTERRRLQTQLEIAHCAAELFAARGASAVTAEDIANAAGISLRTFYRYFRTKEESVAPMLAGGVRDWIHDLARAPRDLPAAEALERSARRALSRTDQAGLDSLRLTHDLFRAIPGDPGLESVWFRIVNDTEESLVEILRDLMGPDADPLEVRLMAVAGNSAMRIAISTWADSDAAAGNDGTPAEIAARCIRTLTAGLRPPQG